MSDYQWDTPTISRPFFNCVRGLDDCSVMTKRMHRVKSWDLPLQATQLCHYVLEPHGLRAQAVRLVRDTPAAIGC